MKPCSKFYLYFDFDAKSWSRHGLRRYPRRPLPLSSFLRTHVSKSLLTHLRELTENSVNKSVGRGLSSYNITTITEWTSFFFLISVFLIWNILRKNSFYFIFIEQNLVVTEELKIVSWRMIRSFYKFIRILICRVTFIWGQKHIVKTFCTRLLPHLDPGRSSTGKDCRVWTHSNLLSSCSTPLRPTRTRTDKSTTRSYTKLLKLWRLTCLLTAHIFAGDGRVKLSRLNPYYYFKVLTFLTNHLSNEGVFTYQKWIVYICSTESSISVLHFVETTIERKGSQVTGTFCSQDVLLFFPMSGMKEVRRRWERLFPSLHNSQLTHVWPFFPKDGRPGSPAYKIKDLW